MPVRIKVGDQILDAPDGLSPKNLALWVRSNMPLQEPTTFSEGFHKQLKDEPIAGGATGYVEGLPGGVKSGFIGLAQLPFSVVQGVIGAIKDAGDPAASLERYAQVWKNKPGEIYSTLQQYADMARKDPEQFGKAIGDLTGNVEAGVATAGVVPLAPKSIAARIGPAIENLGTRAKFPMQLAGAHQLASGNVLQGVGTMMTPSAMESAGGAIRRFGGEPVRPAVAAKLQDQFDTAMAKRNVTAYDERAADALKATKAAEKTAANADKLAQIEKARAGMSAGEPSFTESISAETPEGGRASMSTPYKNEGMSVGDDPITAQLKKQGYSPEMIDRIKRSDPGTPGAVRTAPLKSTQPPAGAAEPLVTPASINREATLTDRTTGQFPEGAYSLNKLEANKPIRIQPPSNLNRKISEFDKAKNKQTHTQLMNRMSELTNEEIAQLDTVDESGRPLSRADRGLEGPEAPRFPSREIPNDFKPSADQLTDYERFLNEIEVPENLTFEGTSGINPPGPTVGTIAPPTGVPVRPAAVSAVPDEWLDAVANVAKKSKSKSKSFLAGGLSPNDVQEAVSLYRSDPTLSPEQAAQQLESLRAGRHSNNYAGAQLSALERQSLAREQE